MATALKLLLWTVVALFAMSLARAHAGAQVVPEPPSVQLNAEVAGVKVKAGASSSGVDLQASSSGTTLQSRASAGGVGLEAGGSGANLQVNASSGGAVQVQASAAEANVEAGASSGGVELSASGAGVRASVSISERGQNAQAGPENGDLRAGTAKGRLSGPPASAEKTSREEQRSVGDKATPAPRWGAPNRGRHAAAPTVASRSARPERALAGLTGVTQPASSVLLDAATIGLVPGDNAPPAPTTSTPAATPSGGSWNLGGSLHAILAAALLLVALGLLHGVRDGSWKPPLEPVRLLASPG